MVFYQKRQDVLEAYQDFYEVRLPKINSFCTTSSKELNEAINAVRDNYEERDYVFDKNSDPFTDLRYMNADE